MSSISTVDDLSNKWEQDILWRLKEISDYKLALKENSITRSALLRGFVPLCYAHWEGYVKLCATHYFKFVAMRKIKFTDLEAQFYINYFLPRMDSFYLSKPEYDKKEEFISTVLESRDKQYRRPNSALIDTKSNLNSITLINICKVCNISISSFEDDFLFIDKQLLEKRNAIAHGENVSIKYSEMDHYSEKVISLMRTFRNLLENKVYNKKYMA